MNSINMYIKMKFFRSIYSNFRIDEINFDANIDCQ